MRASRSGVDATRDGLSAAFRRLALLGLAVGLGLGTGCRDECEVPEAHGTKDGDWLVMEDISRTPGDLEDAPGLLTIADSGEMELTFVRGQPTEYGEFGDPPVDYPHTPHRFRFHDHVWCGPYDGVGGRIVAMGDRFYSVASGEDGDLLVSQTIGGRWYEPISIEVPGMATAGVVDLAAGRDSLAVAFFGDAGIYVARIDDDQVEEPALVFATSEQCLFHQLLMDDDRHLHIVATCDRTGARTPTYATDAGGDWEKEAFPFQSLAGEASIAVGPDGVVHSAARALTRPTTDRLYIAYSQRIDGAWTTPVEAVSPLRDEDGIYHSQPREPQIAVLDDGLVVLAFIQYQGAWWDDETWVRFARDGGPFVDAVHIQQTGHGGSVHLRQLTVDPATGLPVVMFQHYIEDRPSFSIGVAWPTSAEALP